MSAREAADDARAVSALAELPSPRLQPDDGARPRRVVRRGAGAGCGPAARAARLGAPGVGARLAGRQVPPPLRRGASPRTRRDLAARAPLSARRADGGGAEDAGGAPARVRLGARGDGDAAAAGRAGARRAPRAPAGPARGALGSPLRRVAGGRGAGRRRADLARTARRPARGAAPGARAFARGPRPPRLTVRYQR